MKSRNSKNQQQAVDALGCLGDARAVEPLIKVLENRVNYDWEVFQAAARALGQLGDTRVVEPLIKALCISGETSPKIWAVAPPHWSIGLMRPSWLSGCGS